MSDKLEAKDMPLVTSLSDSDTILAVGADGNGKRIASKNVVSQYNAKNFGEGQKWVRVLTIKDASAGLIMVRSGYYMKHPVALLLAYSVSDTRYTQDFPPIAKALISPTNNKVLTKARIVYPKSTTNMMDIYLEVWVDAATERNIYTETLFTHCAEPTLELGSIPEGYIAVEYDTTTPLGGGVNRCTYFAEWRKGGWHEQNDRAGLLLSQSSFGGFVERIDTDYDLGTRRTIQGGAGYNETRNGWLVLHTQAGSIFAYGILAGRPLEECSCIGDCHGIRQTDSTDCVKQRGDMVQLAGFHSDTRNHRRLFCRSAFPNVLVAGKEVRV